MIRINLAKRKQASYVSSAVKGSASSAASFKKNFTSIPDGVRTVLWPLAVALFLHFGFEYYVETQNSGMMTDIKQYEAQKVKIEIELKKFKGFEVAKSDLEKTEKILNTKIDTIQKLIQGRELAHKALIGLSQSIPKDVWLTDFQETQTGWNIKGSSVDVAVVTDFMSKLGQSIYFKEVSLKSSVNDSTGNRANFELSARRE